MRAKALVVTGVNLVTITEVDIPDPGPGEVLVEAAYSCISPGTELRCLLTSLDGIERPYVPGYSMSGTVVQKGQGTSISEGTRVFCGSTTRCSIKRLWGGHISHAIQRESALAPLPDSVSLLDASIAKLAAIAYHGTGLSRPLPSERVAVVGLGAIGQLSARIHTALGAQVIGGDVNHHRVALLNEAGIRAISTREGIGASFKAAFPEGADVVVDATGIATILPKAIVVAKAKPWDNSPTKGARVIVQGSYAGSAQIPYSEAFGKELAFYFPRDNQKQDIEAAVRLMSEGKLAVKDLISDVRQPEDAPSTYQELQDKDAKLLTVAFKWSI